MQPTDKEADVATRKTFSVDYKRTTDSWTIKAGGRKEGEYPRKRDAVQEAAALGRRHGNAELKIKTQDGRVQDHRVYG